MIGVGLFTGLAILLYYLFTGLALASLDSQISCAIRQTICTT